MTDTSVANQNLDSRPEWGSNAQIFYGDLVGLSRTIQREVREKDKTADVEPFLTQPLLDDTIEGVYGINKFEEGAKIQEKYRKDVSDRIYNTTENLVYADKIKASAQTRANVAKYALEGLVDAYARICQAEPPRFELVQKWVDQGVKSFNSEMVNYDRAVKKSKKGGTTTDVPSLEALADQIHQRTCDYFSFGDSGRNALTALIEKKSFYVRAKESATKKGAAALAVGAAALAVTLSCLRHELHPLDASRKYASKAWTATADVRKRAGASISSVGSSIGNAGSSIASRVKKVNKRKAFGYTSLAVGVGGLLWIFGPDVYDYASRRSDEVVFNTADGVKGVASSVQERLDAKDQLDQLQLKLDLLQTTLASAPYNTPVIWDNVGNPNLKNAPGAMYVDTDGNGRLDDNDGKAATVDDLVGMYHKANQQPKEVVKEVRVPAQLSVAACTSYCPTPRVASASKAEPTVAPAPQLSAAPLAPAEPVVPAKKPFKKPY